MVVRNNGGTRSARRGKRVVTPPKEREKGDPVRCTGRVIGILYRCLLATGLGKGNFRLKGEMLDVFDPLKSAVILPAGSEHPDTGDVVSEETTLDDTGPGCDRFGWVEDGDVLFDSAQAGILQKGIDKCLDDEKIWPDGQGFQTEVAREIADAQDVIDYWKSPKQHKPPHGLVGERPTYDAETATAEAEA